MGRWPSRCRRSWGRRFRGGGNRMHVPVRRQHAVDAAPEQERDDQDDRPDEWVILARGNEETARRAASARPEAVSGRGVRRSPQEVGFMMGILAAAVKALCSEPL